MVRSIYFIPAGNVSDKALAKFGEYKIFSKDSLEVAEKLLNAPYDLKVVGTEIEQSVRCHRHDGSMSNSTIERIPATYRKHSKTLEIYERATLEVLMGIDIDELLEVLIENGINVK